MEEELLDVEVEERTEVNEIDGILPLLLRKGLLTEIECRIIISNRELTKKHSAVYRLMMSKTKEEAANLTKIFRTLTVNFHSKENPTLQITELEDSRNVPLNTDNPFLISTVIKILFEHLPLNDLKNFRLVCRQWNSTAEILLRKRSRIVFSPGIIMPDTFVKLSPYSLPDLPFPIYEFAKEQEDDVWEISEVQNFFNHWGKNIKDARFTKLTLRNPKSGKIPKFYDASPWFATACNITTLVINCSIKNRPILNISWEALASLPALNHLDLTRCGILIKPETKFNRISCDYIELHNIGFKQGGKFIPCRYNDVFDFRRSTFIILQNMQMSQSNCILNMDNEVFIADSVTFHNVTIENWGKARGTIETLVLVGSPMVEANNLKIKNMRLEYSQIDLSAVYQNIGRLGITNYESIIYNEPLYLPNLKSLGFDVRDNNAALLTTLENCENLTHIYLSYVPSSEEPMLFSASYIPRKVQLLRIGHPHLDFVDDYIWESSGTLILDDFEKKLSGFTDFEKITSRIRAETLVVNTNIDFADIIKLVFANNQAKTIIIGAGGKNVDLHKKIPFEGSIMSKHVDKKSNYYEFQNQVGKAITQSEFDKWLELDIWGF